MDSDTFLMIFIVVMVLVILIAVGVQSTKKHNAELAAGDKIRIRGIQQFIIKQTPSGISCGSTQGILALTWDTLFFFGGRNEDDREIRVSTIRSTSSERHSSGTNMVIMADSGTFRFHWEDDRKAVSGVAATGGGFASGIGLSKSTNPNVQEWIQLIDDLRFGRLKKPS
jgi:hypothetical protein